MKINNKTVVKFTQDDIKSVSLHSHRHDTWAEITLKSGTEIRSHSLELENLILGKYKSYVAFGAVIHTWLSNNNGEDFNV
tara:strand:- start:545 stop:784 length:240 start_codon:yes stop_codon:yes gene_type:complete